jgi:flagellar biosynthetic protein FlhB
MQHSDYDKTEQATPFKREESRNRGEVQRSADMNTFVVVAAVVAMLMGWGATLWARLLDAGRQLFSGAAAPDSVAVLVAVGREFLAAVIPVGLAAIGLVVLGGLLQTGPVFSFVPLEPRFERINPVSGFRRIFSKRFFFELIKSLVKLGLLGSIVYFFVCSAWPSLAVVGQQSPDGELGYLAVHGATLLTRLAAALLLVGLIDWAFVRWQYGRQLMMSRRDVKEEIKRREGDPQIRARIRELQRENLKQSRSLGRMPDADVLITNPDHLGVALRYVRAEMSAPYVIAKGSGLWLDRMKELARRHAVPIRRQPPLARQLFSHGALERPIPANTYLDVARLYADLAAEKRASAGLYEVRL